MSSEFQYVRHGFAAVRPYVYGHLALWDMVQAAFGAIEVERHEFGPQAFHIEARVGDSVLVLEVSDPPHPGGTAGSIYVYVPDVDESYRRALEHGATTVDAPSDKPFQERMAGVRDTYGNMWWMSTYCGPAS